MGRSHVFVSRAGFAGIARPRPRHHPLRAAPQPASPAARSPVPLRSSCPERQPSEAPASGLRLLSSPGGPDAGHKIIEEPRCRSPRPAKGSAAPTRGQVGRNKQQRLIAPVGRHRRANHAPSLNDSPSPAVPSPRARDARHARRTGGSLPQAAPATLSKRTGRSSACGPPVFKKKSSRQTQRRGGA